MNMQYDGYFEEDGKKIFYTATYYGAPVVNRDGVEKISCFFSLYDESGKCLDVFNVYDSAENLHGIAPGYVREKYSAVKKGK